MKPYSMDLRERVMRRMQAGEALAAVAERYEVHVRTVRRWVQRVQQTGVLAPRPIPGRPRRLSPALEQQVVEHSDAYIDHTLAQHAQWLRQTHALVVSQHTLGRLLRRQRRTRKKDLGGG